MLIPSPQNPPVSVPASVPISAPTSVPTSIPPSVQQQAQRVLRVTPEMMNANLSPESARKALDAGLQEMQSKNLSNNCKDRYREMLTRRANGGKFTEQDAEFWTALNTPNADPKALETLCKQSGNSATNIAAAWAFLLLLGGTTAYAIIKS